MTYFSERVRFSFGEVRTSPSRPRYAPTKMKINAPTTYALGTDRGAYRFGAGLVSLACVGVMALAATLEPSPKGVGTHRELGLAACGFYERTGYPCPTCGMTTAFSHVAHGDLWAAFAVQPAGALGALLCFLGAPVGCYVAATGRAFYFLRRLNHYYTLVVAGLMVLGSWLWLCVLTYLRMH